MVLIFEKSTLKNDKALRKDVFRWSGRSSATGLRPQFPQWAVSKGLDTGIVVKFEIPDKPVT
jgi:hypothetical protein